MTRGEGVRQKGILYEKKEMGGQAFFFDKIEIGVCQKDCFFPPKSGIFLVYYHFRSYCEPMKRSRARVTIGGQYVVLQNYLKIKRFDFF